MKKFLILLGSVAIVSLFSLPVMAAPHGSHSGPRGHVHAGPGHRAVHHIPHMPPRHPRIHVGIGYRRPLYPAVYSVGFYSPYYYGPAYYPPYGYDPYYYDSVNTAANVINAAAATATAIRVWSW